MMKVCTAIIACTLIGCISGRSCDEKETWCWAISWSKSVSSFMEMALQATLPEESIKEFPFPKSRTPSPPEPTAETAGEVEVLRPGQRSEAKFSTQANVTLPFTPCPGSQAVYAANVTYNCSNRVVSLTEFMARANLPGSDCRVVGAVGCVCPADSEAPVYLTTFPTYGIIPGSNGTQFNRPCGALSVYTCTYTIKSPQLTCPEWRDTEARGDPVCLQTTSKSTLVFEIVPKCVKTPNQGMSWGFSNATRFLLRRTSTTDPWQAKTIKEIVESFPYEKIGPSGGYMSLAELQSSGAYPGMIRARAYNFDRLTQYVDFNTTIQGINTDPLLLTVPMSALNSGHMSGGRVMLSLRFVPEPYQLQLTRQHILIDITDWTPQGKARNIGRRQIIGTIIVLLLILALLIGITVCCVRRWRARKAAIKEIDKEKDKEKDD